MDDAPSFLRRREAGQYLQKTYGFCSDRSLGKYATTGGGPAFRKVGIHFRSPVIYERAVLDAWALDKMSAPLQSTSDYIDDASRKHSHGRPRKAGAPEA
jgi:hypothetical protein